MDRRQFIQTSGLAAGFALLGSPAITESAAEADQQATNNGPRILAGPYLQSLNETAVTIMWITSVNCTATVEYGVEPTPDQTAIAVSDGQIDANTTIHSIRITGLKPATRYTYRVVSTEIEGYGPYKVTYGQTAHSRHRTFQTPDADSEQCRFVVFNDIHDRVNTLKAEVAIANQQPYDMIFLNGDIINDPMSEHQIVRYLLNPASELFAGEIPFWLIRGNHETRGAFSRPLKRYFEFPENKYYFAFRQGPVYFVVLDSGEDKEDTHWAYSGLNLFDNYRSQQAEWLKTVIQREEFKQAPFRVVLSHIPLFGSGDAHGTLDCRKKWAHLLKEGKIDLHISGHTHRPAVLKPDPERHPYPIYIGGGYRENNFTVIRVGATTEKLTVTLIGHDGNPIEQTDIKRQ